MKKFLVISTFFIVCTQLVGLCANSSLGPLSQYCKRIKPLFIKISKSVPNSGNAITIELQVNSHGQILQTQLSKSSEGSETNKKTVLQQVKHLKQLEAPPVGTSCPLWLSVDLCNQLDQVCVSVRDLDWKSYMEEVQNRVKQTSVKQHSFPTTSSARKVVTLFFKVHQDGNISKLSVLKSSGNSMIDAAAIDAVKNSAPFCPLLDGVSDPVDIQFALDYNFPQNH